MYKWEQTHFYIFIYSSLCGIHQLPYKFCTKDLIILKILSCNNFKELLTVQRPYSMIHSKSIWTLIFLAFVVLIFGSVLFTVWISVDIVHWRKLHKSRTRNSPFYLFWHIALLLLAFNNLHDSVWFLSQFQQPMEDHICTTKSNITDISLVESCGVEILCQCLKEIWTESLPALYYLVYCECFILFYSK